MVLGVTLGLISGYAGTRGQLHHAHRRRAAVLSRHPALLIDGGARGLLPRDMHDELAMYVLIFAIGTSGWVQYARTVRGSTLVERNKEYVQAARLIGIGPVTILRRHILPNVMGPVLVIATIHRGHHHRGHAVLLGGRAADRAVAGHLDPHRHCHRMWWISIFPGIVLVALVLSVNLLGDWLRDALNPKLR